MGRRGRRGGRPRPPSRGEPRYTVWTPLDTDDLESVDFLRALWGQQYPCTWGTTDVIRYALAFAAQRLAQETRYGPTEGE